MYFFKESFCGFAYFRKVVIFLCFGIDLDMFGVVMGH
ncbi:hypothetical protein Leryth_021835 [Lithospermum erythrorhizon]|nr:hypothetical protein Leryth_021835 [Lithospermum erythrorhizon]